MIRQIAPRCPGSQDPEDAVEDTSVVYPRNATRLIRQYGSENLAKVGFSSFSAAASVCRTGHIRVKSADLDFAATSAPALTDV